MQVKDLPTMKKFTFPVYEVVTPVTNKHFLVRAMTVAQESLIRESSTSDSKRLQLLYQVLFDCIENKEPPFTTMEGFLKNLTINDLDALLFGVIVSTYGESQDYSVKCPRCENEIKGKFILPEIIDITAYDGNEDLLLKEVEIELPISKYKAILKVPTLYDERMLNMNKGVSKDVISKMGEYLIVKKLIIPGVETTKTGEAIEKEYVVDKAIEIYTTFNNLPAADAKFVRKQWEELFGKYRIKLEVPIHCGNCDNEFKNPINLLLEFFRLAWQ